MVDSRAKGRDAEQQLAKILRDELGEDLVQRTGFQQAAAGGFDLLLPGIGLEVKRHARVTEGLLRGWWAQTVSQGKAGRMLGALAYRGNQQEWRIMVPLLKNADENGQILCDIKIEYANTMFVEGFCYWYRETIDVEGIEEGIKGIVH